jgi:hypothetical protein
MVPCPVGRNQGIRGGPSGENFLPNVLPDERLGSFREGHLIREAAFEKHANSRMVKRICCRDQGHVLPDAQVHQTDGFAEDEHFAEDGRLDFFEFLTEVFDESVI